jgi:hypothetical protein
LELKLEDANDPNKLGEGEDVEGKEVVELSRAVDKLAHPPCKSEGVMTVSARPEIYLVGDKEVGSARKEGGIWQFGFGDGFGCGAGTKAFVLRADHPRYQWRLADGTTVGTSTHESWLWPRYATGRGNPNGFVPGQDNLFAGVLQNINASRSRGKIGSYGILGGAQLESL